MGLVCNNVLHERSVFNDEPAAPRLRLKKLKVVDRRRRKVKAHRPPAVPRLPQVAHRLLPLRRRRQCLPSSR